MPIKIFVDADVLMAAVGGIHPEKEKSLAFLADPGFEFIYRPFLKLEVLLLPGYNRRLLEVRFYEEYFETAECFGNLDRIFEIGESEAFRNGIQVLDAIHVAAAHLTQCSALVTLEKATAPMYRTGLVKVHRLI